MKVTPIITNFTAGELSPMLDGRVDIARYHNGVKQLENFIPLPTGGVKRRPGTYYVASTKYSDTKARLVPFQFSTEQAYIIEFGHRYCRFYANHGQLLSSGTITEIETPYLEEHLFDLQFAQDADTMWITHPSYKTRKLTRSVTWDDYTKLMLHCDAIGPVVDEIGKTVTNNNVTLDTVVRVFGAGALSFDGSTAYLSLADHDDWNFGSGDFTIEARVRFATATFTAPICAQFVDADNYWYFLFLNNLIYFVWEKNGVQEASFYRAPPSLSADTWYHVLLVRNGSTWKIFLDGIQVGSDYTNSNTLSDQGGTLLIGFDGDSAYLNGWIDEFQISKGIARWTQNFNPPTSPYTSSEAEFSLNNYAPTADPFGADGSGDCPSCVSIHEQRIFFANTNNNPQKAWASKSGDYENMTTGANAADALVYIIGTEQVNAIRWLSSGRVLGLGTFGGVFSLSSGSDQDPLTPTNVVVKRETSYGSLGVMPKKIGNFTYCVQRNAKIIREFSYSYDIDEYTSLDITTLAEHITGKGIVDMDYQQSPYNILWCVRSDGELACVTRQVDQEVLAWSRQIIGGSFNGGDAVVESVAVIPGNGEDDEVWLIVKRTINGSTKRYVEYLMPFDYGDEQEDAFFADSGLTRDDPKPIINITQADPGVVTATGHNLSNGDIVIIRGVSGMTEVNRRKYKAAGVDGETFQLTDVDTGENIDTSDYGAYVSGGEIRKCTTSISGLSHLALETVDLLLDGDTAVAAEVSGGGTVTLSSPGAGEIHAGLRYIPYLKTMRIEAGSQLGTAQGKLKRISKVCVRVYKSLKMKAGNENTQDEFDFRDPGDDTNDTIEVFSGDQEILMPSAWDKNGYVVITQDDPYPLNIIAIVIYLSVSDG